MKMEYSATSKTIIIFNQHSNHYRTDIKLFYNYKNY